MTDTTSKHMSGEEYEAYQSTRGNKKTITFPVLPMVGVLVVIALMTGSFLAGVEYQKQQQDVTNMQTLAGTGLGMQGQTRRSFGNIGTVTAVTDSSITVKNSRSGESTTYTISASTNITKASDPITVSQIAVNDTVLVQTGQNSSSATATRIIVNPSFGPPTGTQQDTQSL